uniref:Zinc finger and BTB domain containing 7C n=1 Tax=Erpetoichthys calabaricus TaxID=27687 RepID=A0A8C4SVN0_ERPCA
MASSDDDLIGIPFPNHSSDVLCSLNEQRQNGLLCDVLLIVKEHEYYTHRSVLAACSKYFQKLFTVGSSGEQHNVYEIDFVTPESLGAILEFTYTSTLTITASNVKEILNAAQMLEIPCVINVCLEIMETHREADEEEDEEEDDEEEDEEEEENASEILEPQESEKSAIAQNSCPSTSNPERTPEEDFYFSIESLLQEGLYPKINLPDSRPNFSPLMPSFFPPMWAGDFAAFPQILDHRHQEMESGPLDLVIKKEKIKEELKDELQPNGFPSEFFKDLIGLSSRTQLGPIKEESDFSTYLNFLSATHLTGLFPPWQLEEERKMKPKASQQCPICNKVIQGAGKLPRHMRTHTGEKPYMYLSIDRTAAKLVYTLHNMSLGILEGTLFTYMPMDTGDIVRSQIKPEIVRKAVTTQPHQKRGYSPPAQSKTGHTTESTKVHNTQHNQTRDGTESAGA